MSFMSPKLTTWSATNPLYSLQVFIVNGLASAAAKVILLENQMIRISTPIGIESLDDRLKVGERIHELRSSYSQRNFKYFVKSRDKWIIPFPDLFYDRGFATSLADLPTEVSILLW